MSLKSLITHHRAMALKYPCEFAEQCVNPRYFFATNPIQGMRCTVGLTLNVGEE